MLVAKKAKFWGLRNFFFTQDIHVDFTLWAKSEQPLNPKNGQCNVFSGKKLTTVELF